MSDPGHNLRIHAADLEGYRRSVGPAPAPIGPVLSPADEAALLRRRRSPDAAYRARRERVIALIRRPAPPLGDDALLILLLARHSALPVASPQDVQSARHRLAEISDLMSRDNDFAEQVQTTTGLSAADCRALSERVRAADDPVEGSTMAFDPNRYEG